MRRFFTAPLLLLGLLMALSAVASAGDATPPPPVAPPPVADTATAVTTARARVLAGDTMGAIAQLDPYVGAHPADVSAGRLLGDLYFRVPNYRRAEATWRSLVARDPADRETHNRLGGLYAFQDRIAEALAEFERSLPMRDSFERMVELHRRTGDLRQFLADAYSGVLAAPMDGAAQTRYGNVLMAMHRYEEALAPFKRVTGMHPADCSALIDLAYDLVNLHRVDEAVVQLRACLKADPQFNDALVNLGQAYIEKGDFVQAASYIDRALAQRPLNGAALVDSGLLADTAGRSSDAIRFYQAAIAAEPLAIEAYINLGFDYHHLRAYPLAEATFIKGLSVAPGEGRLHILLAVTYSAQGKLALARSQLDLALASDEEYVVSVARRELAALR